MWNTSIPLLDSWTPEENPSGRVKMYCIYFWNTNCEIIILSVSKLYRLFTSLVCLFSNFFQLGADLSNRLARLRFDSLFDYGNELQDIKAVNLVNRFYSYLMNVVQPQLQEENRKRKERAQLTYPNLIPRWLPNGIQS